MRSSAMMEFTVGMYSILVVLFSVLFSISSCSWIGVWVGMEVNLYGAVLLLVGMDKVELGACFKYYFAQCLGSSIILVSILVGGWGSNEPVFWGLICGLMVKLGVPPFHFWVPEVVKMGSMKVVWFVLTVQKFVPFGAVCSAVYSEVAMVLMFSGASALVGGIGGLSASRVSGVLAYSSILHGGWSLAACLFSKFELIFYLGIYWLVLGCVCWLAEVDSYVFEIGGSCCGDKWLLMWSFLSLGGFPPTLGFLGKLMVLMSTMKVFPALGMILVVGSLFSWGYYLLMVVFCLFFAEQKVGVDYGWALSLLLVLSFFGGFMLPVLGV
uniref:NADH-ubiquinone oxidoreductase chain 2 n=1 Tax=Spondylus violaceus TaxID=1163653 RepID=A0A515MNR8_9BIVA|nr:NADH dehydrogenase subunit 2 [Spondylus violaceus]